VVRSSKVLLPTWDLLTEAVTQLCWSEGFKPQTESETRKQRRDHERCVQDLQLAAPNLHLVCLRQNRACLHSDSRFGRIHCCHPNHLPSRGWRRVERHKPSCCCRQGFSIASSGAAAAGTSCSSPTLFGVGTVANNAITAQHIVYDVAVNETLTVTINTCYKATFVVTPNGGSATTYGPVYMNSTVSILTTFRIDCKFDIGSSVVPSSPYSFQLTIQ